LGRKGVKWMDWERQGRAGGFEELERRNRERDKKEMGENKKHEIL